MNSKTIAHINRFGNVGKLVITVLLIAAIIAAFLSGAAAIYTASHTKDAVKITVTNHAEFRIDENIFTSVWNFLANGAAYASNKDLSAGLKDDTGIILPEENTEMSTDLNFFNQIYSTAIIRSDGSAKIIEAASSPAEYGFSDLTMLFVFAALFALSAAAALLLLRKLFKALSLCESPFCMDIVSKMRVFGYSLLPVAVFASIGETLAVRFLYAGKNTGVLVQWGLLIAFAVTMCLVTVFRYGVQLQKESDETL